MAISTISLESNQPSCSPRSSSSCSAPMAMLSAAKPSQSKASARLPSVSAMKVTSPITVTMPTGRLMKKTQRQE